MDGTVPYRCFVAIPGYVFHRRNRNQRRGGGCLAYVRTNLHSVIFNSSETDNLDDSVWFTLPELNILIGCIYNPPSCNSFRIEALSNTMTYISTLHFRSVIVAGDFNMPHVLWNVPTSRVGLCSFQSTIYNLGCTQIVRDPTRGKNMLDLIFTLNISATKPTVHAPFFSK